MAQTIPTIHNDFSIATAADKITLTDIYFPLSLERTQSMRLLPSVDLGLVKLSLFVAICSGILAQGGCDGSGRGFGSKEQILPITPLDYTRTESSTAGIAIVPIFKDGELQFIAGGTKTDRAYNISFGAFTPTGEIAWDLAAKYGDQNPRPYEGRSADMNDQLMSIKTAVNAGDINGDGFDDLYTTVGSLRRHVAIISGSGGKVIVQAEIKSLIGTKSGIKSTPDDIVDLNGDGTKDFRFIFKQKSDYLCIALSGSDLTAIEETTFQLPNDQARSMFSRCLADETGDGIEEILLFVRASNQHGIQKEQKFVVLDGRTFEVVRSIENSIFDRVIVPTPVQSLGDVNGDGVADFLKYATSGAKSNSGNGFVCAQDGASSEIIWDIDGEELGGPDLELMSTPTKTKDTVVTHQIDNELGIFCAVVPDQNGDASQDLVVSVAIDADAPLRRTILLISGTDGSILNQRLLKLEKMSPIIIPLIDPDSKDQKLKVGLLGAADGPLGLVVVEL